MELAEFPAPQSPPRRSPSTLRPTSTVSAENPLLSRFRAGLSYTVHTPSGRLARCGAWGGKGARTAPALPATPNASKGQSAQPPAPPLQGPGPARRGASPAPSEAAPPRPLRGVRCALPGDSRPSRPSPLLLPRPERESPRGPAPSWTFLLRERLSPMLVAASPAPTAKSQ